MTVSYFEILLIKTVELPWGELGRFGISQESELGLEDNFPMRSIIHGIMNCRSEVLVVHPLVFQVRTRGVVCVWRGVVCVWQGEFIRLVSSRARAGNPVPCSQVRSFWPILSCT